ncbi:G patch domain-containing protein 4-like isoform X2 [Haliotis rufescens]|uniref:G patch domain-containing protein 4-like isoform X2 n=1 Tax=Haliotis rufescens TaxID=6454 RepID=UPI00201F84A6|nr:G patch domain-containing protein 4-like isoform X2 [Haliotis rufescens]
MQRSGSGLGREESGMTEAIKVQIKNNKTGVGHDPGAEFTHHWWDHVFNKTAKAIKVGADQNGEVTLGRKSPDSKEEKRAEKARKKMALYGNFVKGATLKQEEGRHVEEKEGSSSESEEEEKIDKPSEEEVFERCGGRTAHKGARHGLKLNGKLQRVQAMEEQLMLQMKAARLPEAAGNTGRLQGQDTAPQEGRKKNKHVGEEIELSLEENSQGTEGVEKKKKRKKEKHIEGEVESPLQENSSAAESVGKKKKRKKEKHIEGEVESPLQENSSAAESVGKKKKRKKEKHIEGEVESPLQENSSAAESVGKKKKRKKEKHFDDEIELPLQENSGLSECDERKRRYPAGETGPPVHEDSQSDGESPSEGRRKRKKCKKVKELEGEEQSCESHHPKKKKKKRKD